MIGYLTDPFQYPFMQRALVEVLLLSVPAGLLGSWIVLRRLSFLTHAVGAATFPGLVLGFGLGFSPWLGAFGVAGGLRRGPDAARAALQARLRRDHRPPARHRARRRLGADVERLPLVGHGRRAALRQPARHRPTPTSRARSRSTSPASRWSLVAGRGLLATSFAPVGRGVARLSPRGLRRGAAARARRGRRLVLGGDRRLRRLGAARRAGGDGAPRRALGAADAARRDAARGGRVGRSAWCSPSSSTCRPAPRSPCSPRRSTSSPCSRCPLRARLERRGARRSPESSLRPAPSASRCSRCSWPARRPGARRPPRGTRARSTSSPRRRSCRISSATSAARVSSVTGILKPNVDPHEYEPRPSDAVALQRREADRRVGRRARQRGWAS